MKKTAHKSTPEKTDTIRWFERKYPTSGVTTQLIQIRKEGGNKWQPQFYQHPIPNAYSSSEPDNIRLAKKEDLFDELNTPFFGLLLWHKRTNMKVTKKGGFIIHEQGNKTIWGATSIYYNHKPKDFSHLIKNGCLFIQL